ncbi:hypothetical protein RRG08_050974 [Elysia crispata]|uniref:Uncharacterized protein n=1 Tax=Elysia crispata TaxID=231223 RepID=A0AAE0ZZT4_9GAST|nr:hypothetical protein RRG08_050974 [Elysia crispata]
MGGNKKNVVITCGKKTVRPLSSLSTPICGAQQQATPRHVHCLHLYLELNNKPLHDMSIVYTYIWSSTTSHTTCPLSTPICGAQQQTTPRHVHCLQSSDEHNNITLKLLNTLHGREN